MNAESAGMGRVQFWGFAALQPRWRGLLVLGLVLIGLGVLAMGYAVAATVVSMVLLGALVAVGGVALMVQAFTAKEWGGTVLHLLLGVLYVVAGVVLWARPVAGALSLTLVLGVFFLASGAMRGVMAVATRYPSWGWTLASGVITFVLGLMVLRAWPATGWWVIGMFVGVDLFFAGTSVCSLAMAARRLGSVETGWRGTPRPAMP